MKAPAFAYCAVRSTSEAFSLLERYGASAKLLAGGQNLIPALNMRLAAPEVPIDISRVDTLRGIAVRDKVLRIGALATHREIGESELGAKGAGEAGTAGAPGAVTSAINDALSPFNARVTVQPFTPERVLRALGKV